MTTLPRRWRIAITASLLLNVLVLAALATLAWRHGRDGGDGPQLAAGLPSPRAMQRALQPQERATMAEVFGPRRRAIGLGLVELGEARGAVRDALLAEPFDAVALEEAFAALREHDATLAADVHDGLAELAGRLDPDGRRRLAEGLRPPRGRDEGPHRARPRDEGRGHEGSPRAEAAGDAAPVDAADQAALRERREAMREAIRARMAERRAERQARRRDDAAGAPADVDDPDAAADDAVTDAP